MSGFAARPLGTLIDPGAEDADLFARERRAGRGHLQVRIDSADELDEPTVSAFAATYAFSLMRGHHAQEALKVLEKLPPAAMTDPSIGLCYGLALAATGQGQKDAGKSYLDTALRSGRLFPQEEALAHNALEEP